MKAAYAKTKDKAEQSYYADENSATEYATDRVSGAAERVTHEGIHQFDKQGRKGVKDTRENIGKAKDKIADFKQKRAVKTAEKKAAGSGNGSTPSRYGASSRSSSGAVRSASQTEKTIKTSAHSTKKTIKQSARSKGKTVKTATKGTVKTAEKGIKTAQTTSKAAVKTTQQAAKAAQATAKVFHASHDIL